MKHILPLLIIATLVCACASEKNNIDWSAADSVLDSINAPEFQNKDYNILEYGAIGDGETDCSESIKEAIAICSENGGGRVIIPEGTFLTGPVHLKSKVNLHIVEKGTLLFIRDYKKYLPVVHARFEGNDVMNYSPLIYAKSVDDIAITGKGTLDGNSDTLNWWYWKGNDLGGWKEGLPNQHIDRELLVEMANNGVPYEERVFGEGHYLRVNFIQFIQCNNILIEGVKIINSPMWEINPVLCKNITVRDVHIDSHGPNNDGCNPESCKNVLIENCYFDTGDDCIAIKSGREEDGRLYNVPSENIIIRNCQMKDGHGGVVIGSEISGGCRNVFIENCTMDSPNLDRALRIKSNSRRGGVIENIFMRNVVVGEVKEAVFLVNFFYEEGDAGKFTPIVRNVRLENVESQKSKHALLMKGYERSPITDIQIKDCKFNGVEDGNVLCYVKGLEIENSSVNGESLVLRSNYDCAE